MILNNFTEERNDRSMINEMSEILWDNSVSPKEVENILESTIGKLPTSNKGIGWGGI